MEVPFCFIVWKWKRVQHLAVTPRRSIEVFRNSLSWCSHRCSLSLWIFVYSVYCFLSFDSPILLSLGKMPFFEVKNLEPDTMYHFLVRACNHLGLGGFSLLSSYSTERKNKDNNSNINLVTGRVALCRWRAFFTISISSSSLVAIGILSLIDDEVLLISGNHICWWWWSNLNS